MLDEARKNAPSVEKEAKYIGTLIKNRSMADQLIKSPRLQVFKAIVERTKADPEFVVNILLQKMTELRRAGYEVDKISEGSLLELFEAYKDERITKNAVEEVIKAMAKGGKQANVIIKELALTRIKGVELKALVGRERLLKLGAASKDELRNSIMSKYRLNVDGAELNGLLGKD
jgi:Glu-tRNA(Gln) amidotransferase subunit E-like FAD-binding protein